MRALTLVLAIAVAGCAHSPQTCEMGKLSTIDQKRADRALVALVASPTWEADLGDMMRDVGCERVECYVRAAEELLAQAANLSTDDSFVVEPHLAIGMERARQWLRNSTVRGACK